ncbi:Cro/CI family transcriptional regulator [Azotobacter vinelandii]
METVALPDLVNRDGQSRVARELGVRPASIAKALKAGRNIIVTVHDDGSYTATEVRPFPSQKTDT